MSLVSSTCGAETTIVHAVVHRPILGAGALVCAMLVGPNLEMTGQPDAFGGCGEVGGDLYRVIEVAPTTEPAYCAVPEEAPVQKEQ